MTASSADLVIEDNGLDPVIEREACGHLIMAFGQVATFRIRFDDETVSLIAAHPRADQATIDHLIDDHIAPRIIATGQELVLHGSAVAIDGRLVILLGQTGSGKSTLGASLHAQGHRLLGDDAVVISETGGALYGESVYPSLRLFPESIEHVFGDPVATTAMAFYSDKLQVAADGLGGPQAQRVVLGAIFILTDGEDGVTFDRLLPADACMTMIENSFTLDPGDSVAAAERMARAARLAAEVPCYELAYPYDFALLKDVSRTIMSCLEHHKTAANGDFPGEGAAA